MKNKMKSLTVFLLVLALALGCFPGFALAEEPEREYETYFEHWNMDAPALNALMDYVEAVTDEASPDYIPEKDGYLLPQPREEAVVQGVFPGRDGAQINVADSFL